MNTLELTNPELFADDRRAYELLAHLRNESPVTLVEPPDYRPFWAVTKHETIFEIEKNPQQFLSGPRTNLIPTAIEEIFKEKFGTPNGFESLVNMDGVGHLKMRTITQAWFAPKNIQGLQDKLEGLVDGMIDKMRAANGKVDFASEIAMPYPLHVVMSILGIPQAHEPLMLKLTQELFGNFDDELGRHESGGDQTTDLTAVIQDFFEYFGGIIEDRRKNPTDDLASVIANAEIDGEPLSHLQSISYFVIVATAGHDTTSHTLAGGLRALIEHPEQLKKLQENPELVDNAVEEMIRWVTPVKSFVRTAKEDCVVEGVEIKAGESLVLYYPSANRDESAFDNPDTFDITRKPNPHAAFGTGPHVCIGRYLARMELAIFFGKFLPILEHIEIDGSAQNMSGIFVVGLKTLPIRYQLAAD